MAYQDKLDAARAKIEEHNKTLPEGKRVNIDDFVTKLQEAGGTSEETLAACSYEDLIAAGLPKLLAQVVANTIFRKQAEAAAPRRVITAARADLMTVLELFGAYDPREENAVATRIKTLAKDRPCVVFNADGTVNVEESAKLVNALRDGYEAVELVVVNGAPAKVYKVGQRPGNTADENPLYPGRKLRPGHVCDQTQRSWEGVPREVREIIYLARTYTREITISSLSDAHAVLDLATGDNAFAKVQQRYPNAVLRHAALQETGQVPTLKVALGDVAMTGGRMGGDPFAVHKTY